jgi:outer membrane immunogenic protein
VAVTPVIAKAPAYKDPILATAYHWTGFYVGAYLGADWGEANFTFLDDGDFTAPRSAGFLGGGEIGFNYQIAKWVVGVEGDLAWTNTRGARPCPIGFFANCAIDTNWLSTLTGRIGYTYWDRLLTYVKGGAAIAQNRVEGTCNLDTPSPILPVAGCPSQSETKIKVGWTVGAGVEFGLTQNVSVKSELMYFQLPSDRYSIANLPSDVKQSGFVSTVGVHLRIGG